jgi:hypothetical protein
MRVGRCSAPQQWGKRGAVDDACSANRVFIEVLMTEAKPPRRRTRHPGRPLATFAGAEAADRKVLKILGGD